MIRDELALRLRSAMERLVAAGEVPEGDYDLPEIAESKSPEHGDYASNFALTAAKKAGLSPRELGERLQKALAADAAFESVDLAGPGFLNLKLTTAALIATVGDVLELGEAYARTRADAPRRINIEFVSVNPNGPITVGSGRGAAFGSTLANVLSSAGHTVHREYYINDGVNSEQMRLFAESVKALVEGRAVPENGYKGDYVQAVADAIGVSGDHGTGWFQTQSQAIMLAKQRDDLATFGVEFDTWFSEQSLHDGGLVDACLLELEAKRMADDEPYRTVLKLAKGGKVEEVERQDQPQDEDDADGTGNTVWLRSTKFADDMDRVLRRKDGRLTYIASDVAYHRDKFSRPLNADKLITVLGPDHHGYIGRLTAVVAALLERPDQHGDGTPLDPIEARIYRTSDERDACAAALAEAKERLEVVIFQIVRFVKEGKPAPMRKRDGNIYALIDLLDELGKIQAPDADLDEQRRIGRDVARYFYLMRSHETHMDFDIDLATKRSDENPVFYVQYAHARIEAVLRKAEEEGLVQFGMPSRDVLGLLTDPRERALIKKIADLPWEVRRCAEDYGVHRLTSYAVELARAYHHFYDGCRVVQPTQPDLSRARIALCRSAQIGLRAVFGLLGISAPERM
ncbi:MAG TPA: arginine--tRNA ligase [Fimbriimonadaceae bacterium]|nr:arginine--tRNA ligase [Fimbriimonadaceae bacterium]